MAKNRVSEVDLTRIKPLSLYSNSPELADIDPRHARVISGAIDYNPSNMLGTYSGLTDYEVQDEEYEAPGVPHMSDITVIKNVAYVDTKNNVRAKIVFRVRNSSGEKLSGVDARLEVQGGTEQP